MIKKYKSKQDQKHFRINERIPAQTLRVIDLEGKQIGVISKSEALSLAAEQGLDVVEIAPMANPPVAKIIDYNKFLYQEEKKKREEKRNARVSETKEVRLGPFMSENDLATMTRRVREFLDDGDKVRLVLKYRGRQITHPEFGQSIMQKVILAVDDISKVDREPKFEGKQLVALLSTERKKNQSKPDQPVAENKDYEEKNQEISS